MPTLFYISLFYMSAVLPNANFTYAIVVKTASKVFAALTNDMIIEGICEGSKMKPASDKSKND